MRQALNKEQRWGNALLSRHQSLEEEFERAKAAVEVSTACTSQPSHVHGETSPPQTSIDPEQVCSPMKKTIKATEGKSSIS